MASAPEAGDAVRLPRVNKLDVDSDLIHEAAAAAEAEHELDLFQCLKLYKKASLWSIFLSTCLIMEGYDLLLLGNFYGFPSFQRKFGVKLHNGSYQLTAAWQAGLSNAALCGEILGLFINGIVADRFGYRRTLIGALCSCIAFIFIVFFAQNLVQLLFGELLLGIPWGIFQTVTTTYASEVCPTHLRAYLTAYVNLCWVIGQFIGSGVLRGMLSLHDSEWAYRIPFGLQWMWPVPLIIGIWLAPESPWWLIRRGRIEEAKLSLKRLTSPQSGIPFRPDETVSLMQHTNEMEKELLAGTSYLDLFRGVNLRRTEIVCMVWMIQTLCGTSFMRFSSYFYEQAGMTVQNAFDMSLGQYAIGILGVFASWFMMRWSGRRALYLYGQLVMVVVLLAIGCISFAGRQNAAAQWSIAAMLVVFIFVYDCTIGPVCYSLVAEVSSTRLRIKSVVLARSCYNAAGVVLNIITPYMINPSSWNWGAKSALFFAGTCFACAVWTFFRLPEPKGRTYAELDILFERGVGARKFSSTVVERLDAGLDGEGIYKEKVASDHMIERVGTTDH